MKSLRSAGLWLVPAGFFALFYFFPLAEIFKLSFARLEGGLGLSQELEFTLALKTLGFTLYQAVLSTLFTLFVGLPGAYLFARYDFPGKTLLRAFMGVPFVMPTLVVAAGFSALLGPQGWLNQGLMALFNLERPPIQALNTLGVILLAHVFYNTTIVLRLVGDYWARLDVRLAQAARTLGASSWQTLRLVTLPLLSPALLAASLLVFIFDFSSFGVILVLGGPRFSTLETEIFYQSTILFNLPAAAFLSLLQLGCMLGLALVYAKLTARLAAPGQARPRRPTRLFSRRQWLLAAGILTPLLVLFAAPLAALVVRSFIHLAPVSQRMGDMAPGFTLAFYLRLFENPQASAVYIPPGLALLVSAGYAAVTVVCALAFGLPVAWQLSRPNPARLAGLLDAFLLLPLGTSAVTLGLGFLVAFDSPPLDLRLSPILVPLAHTLVAFPFVVRALVPALRSIQPGVRQAAAMLGAAPWQVWKWIELPLIGRALGVAAAFAFTISLGEFGATALIARPELPTVPTAIYRLISRPGALNYGQAIALSTILMLVTAAAIMLIERLKVGPHDAI